MAKHSKHKKIRLYYLGSGEIGIPVLESLVSCQTIDLLGCATQPNRPKGRKRVSTPTPIGRKCKDLGLEPAKPESVNSPDFLKLLRSLDVDLVIVFSFGQILRKPLLNLPRFGCLNIHTSLLPSYRGASPISAAILSGDSVSGISFMKMDQGLDTGPIYQQFKIRIPNGINAQELERDMATLAAEHVCGIIISIVKNELHPYDQNETDVSYANKVKKDDGRISWLNEASYIERQVRAYYPWPGAWFIRTTQAGLRKITITSAKVGDSKTANDVSPGTVLQADQHGFEVACTQGSLFIEEVIPEGKRQMCAVDYLRGNPMNTGIII